MAEFSDDRGVDGKRKLLLPVLALGAIAVLLLVAGIVRQSKGTGRDQPEVSSSPSPPAPTNQTVPEHPEAPARVATVTGAESERVPQEESVFPEIEQDFATPNLDRALKGLPEDQPLLLPGEREKAIALFSKERAMWDKIDKVGAEIEIVVTRGETGQEALRGHLSMEKERHKPKLPGGAAWTCHTTITDADGKWTFYTDGTPKGTRVECSDERRGAEIREPLAFTLPWEIMAPQVMLVGAYEDELLPPGTLPKPRSKERYFAAQSIRHPVGETEPSAGDYDYYTGYVPENVLAFRKGHVHSFGRGRPGHEPWKYVFEDYLQVGQFWFPTLVTVTEEHGAVKRVYRFRELEINASAQSRPSPAFDTE